ncbi:hypothetical protein [uncultured Shimia sp.]|uniref:hypothetical protein n=1 Tax=uncultured Shimia sp. TaxID=573152 RepID=UPI00261AF937|nr:hypothetical protein [uncultured Shimia sp.]
MTKLISALMVATCLAAPVGAQTWSSNAPQIGPVNQPEGILIEAYPTSTNHCQAGYQPVVFGGVICCGKPNATYNASHSAPAMQQCAAGTKGCS